jgi:hypothetical protein
VLVKEDVQKAWVEATIGEGEERVDVLLIWDPSGESATERTQASWPPSGSNCRGHVFSTLQTNSGSRS